MKVHFRFSSEQQDYGAINNEMNREGRNEAFLEATKVSNDIMIRQNASDGYFNNWNTYIKLLIEQGCQRVEIDSLRIKHHERAIHCIEVVYRSTVNGHLKFTTSPSPIYWGWYYSYTYGEPQMSCLKLGQGEFIHGLILQQGDVLNGVTFVTNKRKEHFGGYGGNRREHMILDSSMKIVSFAGTVHGVIERIGFHAISRRWEVIGHVQMLRYLVSTDRARPILSTIRKRTIYQTITEVIRMFCQPNDTDYAMTFLVDKNIPNDIVRHILGFLL